ncbi:hypothetical protein PENTCL1PPCAC_10090, partial [Pristionchus entomophagus]
SLPSELQILLDQSHVHIRDRPGTVARLVRLIEDGASNLTIISDFDHTLSRSHDDEGKRCPVTHEVFGHPERLPELSKKFAQFEQKYGHFEHHTEGQERMEAMEAWWMESNEAIVERGFDRSELAELVAATNIQLRNGAEELLLQLNQREMPILIFSAGIGDVISIFLDQFLGGIPRNTHIVSNRMAYDEQDRICGFSDPLIHCFNKSGAMIEQSSPILPLLAARPNVLLLGDALGDARMVEGLSKEEEGTLRVGFLNKKPDMLSHFTSAFDIVIVDDQTMEIPVEIVKMLA